MPPLPLPSRRWHDPLALILVLLVALLPRVTRLGADPPVAVTGAFLSDEGWWAQNARQRVLFGEWVMDEHNPGLYAAPAYTAALTLTYQTFGLGLVQTRLLSALAGALACVILLGGLRAVLPLRQALPAALLFALGAFPILQSRLALTETLQLAFAVVVLAGALWATRYPPFGAITGLGLVGAVLSKPNAVILGPILALTWWLDYRQRTRAGEPVRPLWLQVAATGLAAAIAGIVVVVFFLLPNWSDVRAQMAVSLANVTTQNDRLSDGGVLVFMLPFLSLRPSMLFATGVVPVLGLVLLLWRRLVRTAGTPLDPAERLAWVWWWLMLGYIATQAYQPDRRFLLLSPALAILGARGLFGREEGSAAPDAAPVPRGRAVAAGALCGALLGLFLMYFGIPILGPITARLGIGGSDGLAAYTMQVGLWHAALFAGAVGGPWLARRLAAHPWRVPAAVWLVLFLLLEPLMVARDLLHPSYSELQLSRAIAKVSRNLLPRERVMTGFLANSLALESDIFPFYIRDEPAIGAAMNLDGWERFHPMLAVTATRHGRRVGLPLDPAAHGLVPLCTFPLWHEVRDANPLEVTLWLDRDQPRPPCPAPGRPVLQAPVPPPAT